MRHIPYIQAAICLLLAASCGRIEPAAREPMTLGAAARLDTKALVLDPAFPTERAMYVSADFMEDSGEVGSYFQGETFTSGGGLWRPASGSLFWPHRGHLELLAYSVGNTLVQAYWNKSNLVRLNSDDFTADDVLAGGLTMAGKTSNLVIFDHLLSLLRVRASAVGESTVRIKKVSVRARKGASLAIVRDPGSSQIFQTTTLRGLTSDVSVIEGGYDLPSSPAYLGMGVTLPEQMITSVTVEYCRVQGGVEGETVSVTRDVEIECLAGYYYVLSLTMSLEELSFSVSVSPWSEYLHEPEFVETE